MFVGVLSWRVVFLLLISICTDFKTLFLFLFIVRVLNNNNWKHLRSPIAIFTVITVDKYKNSTVSEKSMCQLQSAYFVLKEVQIYNAKLLFPHTDTTPCISWSAEGGNGINIIDAANGRLLLLLLLLPSHYTGRLCLSWTDDPAGR